MFAKTTTRSLVFVTTAVAWAAEFHHPSGFRIDLPPGWQATTSGQGHMVMVSPNPQMYVFVRPVLNRTADCAATLKQVLSGSGSQFAGVSGLEIAPSGPRQATARFVFQGGKVRGAMLCAETSRGSGMLYGMAAPVNEFTQQAPRLLAVLRSFAFETTKPAGGGGGGGPLPPLNASWQEPNEMAYTLAIPQGWRGAGGIKRFDATHYTNGVQLTSGDGGSVIRIGDQRLNQCMVPGPGAMSAPGVNYCAMQSGMQFGSSYLRMLAQDLGLSNGQIISNKDRPDLAQRAEAVPASFGLRVKISVAEVRFHATRKGAPVEGAFLAQTTLFAAVPGQNFLVGTQSFDVSGFAGPAEQAGTLSRLTGAIRASQRVNPVWWSQTQQINQEIAQKTLATLRAEATHQQEAFWDRMAASDRRREGVNDILGGTVRLSDGQGNQYNARAGSNYYFLDTEAARTAGRPDDAVRGADIWPSPMVDLKPLEVIR